MNAPAIPLSAQIEELDLVVRAKRNAIGRARTGEIKRPAEWVERRIQIADARDTRTQSLVICAFRAAWAGQMEITQPHIPATR